MANVHRNDALNFFESMTEKEQQVAIRYLQKIIKKPPDAIKDLHDSQFDKWEQIKSDRGGKVE